MSGHLSDNVSAHLDGWFLEESTHNKVPRDFQGLELFQQQHPCEHRAVWSQPVPPRGEQWTSMHAIKQIPLSVPCI